MKKLLFVVISCFVFCSGAFASDLKTVNDVEKATETAMKLVEKGQINEFVESLKPVWKIPETDVNLAKDKLISQQKQSEDRFGKALDVLYVKTEIVADTLVKIDYIQKFENNAMRWTFYYYKPAGQWYLNTFFSDPQIILLFK